MTSQVVVVELLIQFAKTAGVLAGLVVTLTLLGKSPVGGAAKWVYVQLVGEPIGAWFRAQVGQVVDEKLLARNGGTTVPDAIERIDKVALVQGENHKDNVRRLLAIEERLPPKEIQ